MRKRPQTALCSGDGLKKSTDSSHFHTSKSAGKLRTKIRPNSSTTGKEKTGKTLETINNILNGITASINRLTELQQSLPKTASATYPSEKKQASTQARNAPGEENLPEPPVVKIRALRKKVQTLAAKLSPLNTTWSNPCTNISGMSGKVNEKKNQKDKATEKMNTDTREPPSSAPVKKKLKPYTKTHVESHYGNSEASRKHFEMSPHKLVEIYHNNAVKESDSEEEKNKSRMKAKCDKVPNIKIPCQDCGDCKEARNCNHSHEAAYEEPEAPRSCYHNKSYELPTISSKMKQAVKLDFNMFNFKAIPFCPASSTTPSHNIGINIQQVMSIIKTRQPVQGISPTLAHNINLAAEKLNNDPLTSLVSSMTSRLGYGKSGCPLNKYCLNYRQLEEMARTVPEEPAGECVSPDAVGGPSGDMQTTVPPGPHQWTASNHTASCTCAPTTGVDFHHVYNKYRNHHPTRKNFYLRHQPNMAMKSFPYPEAAARKSKHITLYTDGRCQQDNVVFVQDNVAATPFTGKEKNLKEVLINLHDDFEAMNKKYETMSSQATEDSPNEMKEEMQELEIQLNKKEREINIVMALYKEVLALKQQIRTLTSRCAMYNVHRIPPAEEDCRSNTTKHITKLLKQIHHYNTYHRN